MWIMNRTLELKLEILMKTYLHPVSLLQSLLANIQTALISGIVLMFSGFVSSVSVAEKSDAAADLKGATIIVAASDSSASAKARADFIGDGEGDQEQINAAVKALPEAGGTVLICAGTYDIRRIPGKLGGVLIERSNVTLSGQGPGTRLVLAARQNINVIRILGAGIGNVVVRDLSVDANRLENSEDRSGTDVVYAHFEFCGIKAYGSDPRRNNVEVAHDVTVENCTVKNAKQLGVMMEGSNMRCLNNLLGNCGSDCVELLGGPGMIIGNVVDVTERVHVAVGSDRANGILMQNNIVQIKKGGFLDIGFRSWAGTDRHIISGNLLHVEEGGRCSLAMDIRGRGAVILSNNVTTSSSDQITELKITAGDIFISGNLLRNVLIRIKDETEKNLPIRIGDNLLQNVTIQNEKGNLIQSASSKAN